MKPSNKPPRACNLAALTGAALALPAIAQLAQGETDTDKTEFGYRYSQYQEDNLGTDKVFVGSRKRYQVENHQFRLATPVAVDKTLTIDADYETVSGASPYGTVRTPDGQSRLIMSGASIDDTRKDILASLRVPHTDGALTYALGYSTEKDYEAWNGAVEFEQTLADRLTTWSGGIGFSSDTIEPVQTQGINRIDSEDKWSANGFLALAKVLSPVWQVQGGVFAGMADGFLSDAYKALDARPDQRKSFGITGRSRYYLKNLNAATHVDYRFYNDDWGIESHTVELAWHQSLGDHIRVVPMVRYYSQSQADFYVEADDPQITGEYSSDYRMSPFGALSWGLSLILEQPDYRIILRGEQYESDGDMALKNVDVENPALVSYTLMTVGFDYRF